MLGENRQDGLSTVNWEKNKQKNRIGERNGMWREKPERWSLEEL